MYCLQRKKLQHKENAFIVYYFGRIFEARRQLFGKEELSCSVVSFWGRYCLSQFSILMRQHRHKMATLFCFSWRSQNIIINVLQIALRIYQLKPPFMLFDCTVLRTRAAVTHYSGDIICHMEAVKLLLLVVVHMTIPRMPGQKCLILLIYKRRT